MSDRAVVKNAADREQVKDGRRFEKRAAEHRAQLLAAQLSTYTGREFVWTELERHGLYESITRQSSEIYVLSGRRDAGLELLAEIVRDHGAAYLQMQTEAFHRAQRRDAEIDAAHTPSAQPGASNG